MRSVMSRPLIFWKGGRPPHGHHPHHGAEHPGCRERAACLGRRQSEDHQQLIQKKKKMRVYQKTPSKILLPAAGLEPARCRHQWILSPPRLPFRQAGVSHQHALSYQKWIKKAIVFSKRIGELLNWMGAFFWYNSQTL